MDFSPNLMGQIPVETVNMKERAFLSSYGPSKPQQVFHWTGGHSAWLHFAQQCSTDQSTGGDWYRENWGRCMDRSSWSPFPNGTMQENLSRGFYPDALEAFNRAQAAIKADRFTPGKPLPAVAGGAWIVPLVLANNPLPARLRTRTKLAPKVIELGVSINASINQAYIAKITAELAKACWSYIEMGGAVDLTVHYVHGFRQPHRGCEAFILSIKVPLTSKAAFASAISVHEYRGSMMLACGLSGQENDSIPLPKWDKPGLTYITGDEAVDKAALIELGLAA